MTILLHSTLVEKSYLKKCFFCVFSKNILAVDFLVIVNYQNNVRAISIIMWRICDVGCGQHRQQWLAEIRDLSQVHGGAVSPRDFTVRVYESGAMVKGCSAFEVGLVAALDFGNPGQLDAGGVVTRGAGDGIRVDIRAVDAEADYRGV